MQGIGKKQIPLAETDQSALYGADPSCHGHGQVRSAAADVVACHILRRPQRGYAFSRRRSASEAPVNLWGLCMYVCDVICDSGKTTPDPSTHTNTLTATFFHTSVVMAIVNKVLSFTKWPIHFVLGSHPDRVNSSASAANS